jgi:hypothetical protein
MSYEFSKRRWRAERALGKRLPLGAKVYHHGNEQLVICQSNADHAEIQRKHRIRAEGGDPWRDYRCWKCKQLRPRSLFGTYQRYSYGHRPGDPAGACKDCRRAKGDSQDGVLRDAGRLRESEMLSVSGGGEAAATENKDGA